MNWAQFGSYICYVNNDGLIAARVYKTDKGFVALILPAGVEESAATKKLVLGFYMTEEQAQNAVTNYFSNVLN